MTSEEKLDHILSILNAQQFPSHLEYKVFVKKLEDIGISIGIGDLVEKLKKDGYITSPGFMFGITEDGRIFWDSGNGGYVKEKEKKLEYFYLRFLQGSPQESEDPEAREKLKLNNMRLEVQEG